MRYADGGGLTTGGRSRREQVRLQAAQIQICLSKATPLTAERRKAIENQDA